MADGPGFASPLGASDGATLSDAAARSRQIAELSNSPDVPAELRDWARRLVEEMVGSPALATAPHGEYPIDAAPPPRPVQRRSLLDRILTSWIVLASIILAAVIAGVVVARSGLLTGGTEKVRPHPEVIAPVPIDEARIAELTIAADAGPDTAAAIRELAQIYLVAGDWQSSIVWNTRLLGIDGTDTAAIASLGVAAFNLGRRDQARGYWFQGLALAPGDQFLHYSLGHLYATATPPDLAAARSEWQKVIDANPNSNLTAAAQQRLAALGQ